MCRSMADIQSTAAEIRRGKKEEEERKKKETTGQKYNGPLLHRAAIIMTLSMSSSKDRVIGQSSWSKGEKLVCMTLSESFLACFMHSVKAKFHYASWFEACSKLVADRFEACRRSASNHLRTS